MTMTMEIKLWITFTYSILRELHKCCNKYTHDTTEQECVGAFFQLALGLWTRFAAFCHIKRR